MAILNQGGKGARRGLFASGRHRERNSDEGIIPLINVVFLLLIFFMLAGKLSQIDPFEVTPPDSASESLPDGSTLTVLVGADGRIAFDGKPLELEALPAALAEHSKDGAVLRLKADQQAEADRVIEVMESLRAAGIEKLSLLTTKAGTAP
ncbi:ExbD/TolR family protein [Oceanibaculum nanhaiense]|uniref:ExbD/TolR family protein n=1 Tax=Oceanibaculum nanhaiense TaxID=1909734 RepID=UPI00396EFA70